MYEKDMNKSKSTLFWSLCQECFSKVDNQIVGNLNNFVIKIIPFEKTLTFIGRVDEEWSNARKYSKELAINLEEKFQDLTKVKIVIWKRLNYQADAHYECIEVIKIPFQKNVKRRIVRSSLNNLSFGGPFHWRLE